MSNNKFTSGPWAVEHNEIWNQNTRIAKIVVDHPYHAEDVNYKANAALIAAAPELLAALEALMAHDVSFNSAKENLETESGKYHAMDAAIVTKVEAALRKARGG